MSNFSEVSNNIKTQLISLGYEVKNLQEEYRAIRLRSGVNNAIINSQIESLNQTAKKLKKLQRIHRALVKFTKIHSLE